MLLKVATCNMRACVSTNGRRDPQRIADVIRATEGRPRFARSNSPHRRLPQRTQDHDPRTSGCGGRPMGDPESNEKAALYRATVLCATTEKALPGRDRRDHGVPGRVSPPSWRR